MFYLEKERYMDKNCRNGIFKTLLSYILTVLKKSVLTEHLPSVGSLSITSSISFDMTLKVC